jgi:hypothetical protein
MNLTVRRSIAAVAIAATAALGLTACNTSGGASCTKAAQVMPVIPRVPVMPRVPVNPPKVYTPGNGSTHNTPITMPLWWPIFLGGKGGAC